MLTDFGRASMLSKARQQPDKVKMVLDKVKTDGLATTIEAVRSKLDQPLPLGYCNVGRVLEAPGTNFKVGERVVSNGHHAQVVRVPTTCAREFLTASTMISGFHGFRCNRTSGDSFGLTYRR